MSVSMGEEKNSLINMMRSTTLEVTPGGAAKVADFSSMVRPGCTIYVTFLPGSDFADTPVSYTHLRAHET